MLIVFPEPEGSLNPVYYLAQRKGIIYYQKETSMAFTGFGHGTIRFMYELSLNNNKALVCWLLPLNG